MAAVAIGFASKGLEPQPSTKLERHVYGTMIASTITQDEIRPKTFASVRLDNGETITVRLPPGAIYLPGPRARLAINVTGDGPDARRTVAFDRYEEGPAEPTR